MRTLEMHQARIDRPSRSRDDGGASRVSSVATLGEVTGRLTVSPGTRDVWTDTERTRYSGRFHFDNPIDFEPREDDRLTLLDASGEYPDATSWRITSVIRRRRPLSNRLAVTLELEQERSPTEPTPVEE